MKSALRRKDYGADVFAEDDVDFFDRDEERRHRRRGHSASAPSKGYSCLEDANILSILTTNAI